MLVLCATRQTKDAGEDWKYTPRCVLRGHFEKQEWTLRRRSNATVSTLRTSSSVLLLTFLGGHKLLQTSQQRFRTPLSISPNVVIQLPRVLLGQQSHDDKVGVLRQNVPGARRALRNFPIHTVKEFNDARYRCLLTTPRRFAITVSMATVSSPRYSLTTVLACTVRQSNGRFISDVANKFDLKSNGLKEGSIIPGQLTQWDEEQATEKFSVDDKFDRMAMLLQHANTVRTPMVTNGLQGTYNSHVCICRGCMQLDRNSLSPRHSIHCHRPLKLRQSNPNEYRTSGITSRSVSQTYEESRRLLPPTKGQSIFAFSPARASRVLRVRLHLRLVGQEVDDRIRHQAQRRSRTVEASEA